LVLSSVFCAITGDADASSAARKSFDFMVGPFGCDALTLARLWNRSTEKMTLWIIYFE
jgi:hypothetical protein